MTTEPDGDLDKLLIYLRDERGFDFTGYKRASLSRRVMRRMQAIGIESFEVYHDYLIVHPGEFTQLFNTILINVTSFFRDADAWSHLAERVLPDLLVMREHQPLRVWSAGCASGEEAYSLAITLAHLMGVEAFRERVKIYATDVDEDALATARQATYDERAVANVPEELLERYLLPVGRDFVVRPDVRRAVIFGRNDLVQDAPISHIDLLAFRNTLMYFNAQTQQHILKRMHFALRPQGVLFLGKAELLLSHAAFFRPLEIKRRFFVKNPDAPDRRRGMLTAARLRAGEASDHARLRQAALLAAPTAQIVVDVDGEVASINARAATLFGLTERDDGRPLKDLELSYRPLELRQRLQEMHESRRVVWARDVSMTRGTEEEVFLDVQFVPLFDEIGTTLGASVVFHDVTRTRQLQRELEFSNRALESAYEELQSTNEELETTNEELQSTVEELETTNEELQSTNEELETMNEELQSMNDELQLGNVVLRDGQDDLDRVNRFMGSVLDSMRAGVAVLSSDLRVLAWNAKAEDLWGVRSDEAAGVLLTDLDIGLPMEGVERAIRGQFGDGDGRERDVRLLVSARNRRGRTVDVQVTVSRMEHTATDAPGAVLVMDVVPTPLAGERGDHDGVAP